MNWELIVLIIICIGVFSINGLLTKILDKLNEYEKE